MTFSSAAGWGNLPNGSWSPVIYSKLMQLAFRKQSVIQAITNTDYMGEIADAGDTVRILLEPNITVKPYKRGTKIETQPLDDDEITLIVDKANYFSFEIDDIETKMSHVGWEATAADQGAYRLRDAMDSEVLNYISGEIPAAQLLGTTANPIEVVTDGSQDNSASFSPLSALNRLKRLLDENNVPEEGRWVVFDPVFAEKLGDEDSKILDNDFTDKGILRNGMVANGKLRGFTLYSSNNLPQTGAGSGGTGAGDYGYLLAGHMSAVATAEQINKVEQKRSNDSFGDEVRALHLYGRKALRDEALVGMVWHSV